MKHADVAPHWQEFLQPSTPLCVLSDLDGTLIPFANTPAEAVPSTEVIQLIGRLASLDSTLVAIVSGRPRDFLDAHFGDVPGIHLVAEHGVWHRHRGQWQTPVGLRASATDDLAKLLEGLAARFAGALVERKTWSVGLHYRRVKASERAALLVEAAALVGPWLTDHDEYEHLGGEQVMEFRPRSARKSSAVDWVRSELEFHGRCLAVGDDVTDEDMFTVLADGDEAVLVSDDHSRSTAARWRLPSVEAVIAFYGQVVALRTGALDTAQVAGVQWPQPVGRDLGRPAGEGGEPHRLLVVSNRLPEFRSASPAMETRRQNVGGLVAALAPVLVERHGLWFGWDGTVRSMDQPTTLGLDDQRRPALAWMNLADTWYQDYYKGFCNGTLWPLLHSFPHRAHFRRRDWESYGRVNETFASAVPQLVEPDAAVWVHDYHLLLLGQQLRQLGHTGRLGLFLHVPFPGPDIFFLMPWAEQLLQAMLAFDLVGFHTESYAANFRHAVARLEGRLGAAGTTGGGAVKWHGREVKVGAFPIGIIPDSFQEPSEPAVAQEIERLVTALTGQRLILGVDRLDYTKGIPERILAFGRLLREYPAWRRRVALVQVSVPSRADVPDYEEQRARIEETCARINGEFGEADWVPIRYLYRSYGRNQLQQLYRSADVGYVTPLRDGMNLVAKEFVAAQDPERPGVLVLSKFAGAAEDLDAAVLTNPWDQEGMAEDLHRALSMDLAERQVRHRKLLAKVQGTTALTWAESYLNVLLG